MNDLDVERRLVGEWQAFVDAGRPDADLAAGIIAVRGARLSRRVLWAELEDVILAYAEVRAAIADDARANAPATTHWSVRQLVAHVASWAAEFRRQVETVADGRSFDYLITFIPRVGPTEWNEREVARRRDHSLDALFAELESENRRLQALALTLPEDVLYSVAELPQTPDGLAEHRWRQRLADLLMMKCWHDRYHLDRFGAVLHLDIE